MDKATYKLPKKYSKYLMSTYITAVWPEIVDFNKITYGIHIEKGVKLL